MSSSLFPRVITPDVVPVLRSVRTHETEEGELFLYVTPTRELVQLNVVGSGVLALVDGVHDVGAIAAELSRAFDVDANVAYEDVCAFVLDLERRGALDLRAPSERP